MHDVINVSFTLWNPRDVLLMDDMTFVNHFDILTKGTSQG
jgi:hypothetical protein